MEYKSTMGRALLLTAVLALLRQGDAQGSNVIITALSDAVHTIGDNVQYSCKISADPAKEAMRWSRTLRNTTVQIIYQTHDSDSNPLNNAKYDFKLTAPLESYIIVKNVQYDDVGMYQCQAMSKGSWKEANLVIVGKPVISIPGPLLEDKEAKLTCDIYYSGVQNKFNAAGLEPELIAMIGKEQITLVTPEKSPPSVPDQTTRLRLDYNLTLEAAHDGLNFTCGARVQRENPTKVNFEIVESRKLSVAFAVRDVKIIEPREHYYPNDIINCTAQGNPQSQITWIPVKSEGADAIHIGGVLTVDEQMVGDNEWKCRAENNAGGTTNVKESPSITFHVMTPTDPPAGESTGGDGTTIAIAVAVPVGIILVVVVVVCIVCAKKKKGGAKPKTPDASEAGAGSTRQRNQIYKPVSTKPEGQVSFQDEQTASYKPKETTPSPSKPMAAPRREDSTKEKTEVA